jgi:hypothetical protein
MNDRRITIACIFDLNSPRITAYQIPDCIYEKLQLPEEEVRMIQIDGPKRQVYIKFATSEQTHVVLQNTAGQLDYRHDNGEISIAHIELAGMDTRRFRIANLPPEVPERAARDALSTYGYVKEIREETWSREYKYAVTNGIRVATTCLKNTFHHIYP